MGVPVVSLAGAGMVGCLSASILAHAGCGDWIAADDAAFLDIGKKLAAAGHRSCEERLALRQQVCQSPLADGARLARELEHVYAMASQRRPAH